MGKIAGIWISERALSNSVVQIMGAVGNVTESLRQATKEVDQKLERMQGVTNFISTASAKLSQKVIDEGVFLTLLPDEKQQNLAELSTSVKEAISPLRDMLSAGLVIYRSIDQLPFVSLPAPSQDQVDKITQSAGEVQSAADSLEAEIASFRSGAGRQIGKVQTGADMLTARLGESRDRLASLDARLAIAQESLVQLQETALRVLALVSVLFTLLMAWVIYSQVELLRLYGRRWKVAGTKPGTEALATQPVGVEDQTAADAEVSASEIPEADPTSS
jgi:chromosome segregation ATPase